MVATVEVKLVGLSGEVLADRTVPTASTIGDLRPDLARELGVPPSAIKLLDGTEDLGDGHCFQQSHSEALLTCIVAHPPKSRLTFFRAVRDGHHGLVAALLRAAGREELRGRLFLRPCMQEESGDSGDSDEERRAVEYGTLLHAAAHPARAPQGVEVTELLVDAAASAGLLEDCLLWRNPTERTALHLAAQWSPERVRLLLAAAARAACLERVLMARAWHGETALHLAARAGQLESAELLLAAAAEEASLAPLLLARCSFHGRTALHEARRHAALLRRLCAAAHREGLLEELLDVEDSGGGTVRASLQQMMLQEA